MKGCQVYGIATMYLREESPWTRTLRELGSAGKLVFKDEITRRIVVEFTPNALDRIRELVTERASAASFEVKIVCRGASGLPGPNAVKKWRRIAGKNAAYGVVEGRYVFAELVGKSLVVKLGRETRSRNPPYILPSSAFQFAVDEVGDAMASAARLARSLEDAWR
ncbi:MAG: hypothetical protein F7C38_06705 [Desulfurococcales archaeon]|nr:hypothetical protein [Desulfurococcales archaeon]